MSHLRLCFIGRADSVHTRRWVDPFVERGDQVWVINAAACPSQRPWANVRLIDLPAELNTPWVRYPVWMLRTWAVLRRLRPDLLHAHCLDLSGWLAAAVGYHPTVVTVWGSDILLHPDRSPVARGLARWVLSKADAVTVPAEPLFERAVSFAGATSKVHVIHWGVDCQVFRPEGETVGLRDSLGLAAKAPILLCPRALAPIYDIETVLRMFKHVLNVVPQAILLLVEFHARPDYRRKIDQWIHELGLRKRVHFIPQIRNPSDMAALYRLASVIISLPLSDSLSLTVMEAMACSTPVVVSDLPAYGGWVVNGETGYRVPIRDAAAAATAVLLLLTMESKRIEIGKHARMMVLRRATLEQQKQNAFTLYHDLLSKRQVPTQQDRHKGVS